jgi:hypothetical protein
MKYKINIKRRKKGKNQKKIWLQLDLNLGVVVLEASFQWPS